jgi:hypothetical protein
MPNCKKCNAELVFIQMTTGGVMPCNVPSHKITLNQFSKDTFIVLVQSGGQELGKIMCGEIDPNGKFKGYTSHFATCPYALNFKKKEVRNGE